MREPDLPPEPDDSAPDAFWKVVGPLPPVVRKPCEPWVFVTLAHLFPRLPQDTRIAARKMYRKTRRSLTTESAKRAVCIHVLYEAGNRMADTILASE